MVIFLQLCLFLLAIIIRGRLLFGLHLKKSEFRKEMLTYTASTKHGIAARHVGIHCENGIPFIIKHEKWYHRILKNIGIASEIKILNDDFDKKYFITTDYPGHLEQALASGNLQEHLQKLFALPVKSLHATSHKIWCVIRKDDLQKSDNHYVKQMELLSEISKANNISSGYGVSKTRKLGLTAFVFICVHAGLLTLGIFGALPTYFDSNDIIDISAWITKGIIFGVIAAAIWFFAILNVFRGSSWICWVFVDFILCGIIGFFLSGIFIVREANTHLAQSPAHIFEQPIIQKVCVLECKKSCGRRCTRTSSYRFQSDITCSPQSRQTIRNEKRQTDSICASNAWFEYTLDVKHWREPSNYSFSPSVNLFDSVTTGSILNVPVNNGALGLEWVDTNQIRAK